MRAMIPGSGGGSNRGLRAMAAAGAAVLATVAGGLPEAAAQQTERVDLGVPISADAYIRVFLEGEGSVRIVGWNADSVHVNGTHTAGVGQVAVGGDESSAKVGYWPDAEGHSGRADLEVRLPASATVWVKLTDASADISGVTGGLDVYAIKGDVRVSGNPSELSAESMGGGLELSGASPTVKAKTGSGPITFRGESDDVSLMSVSGRITVSGPRLKWGHFESVKGDIVFEGDLAKGGSVTFKNHHGRIELHLPEQVGAEFTVTTWEGELTSDFDLGPEAEGDARAGKRRTFTVGKGLASVDIQNFGGDVRIERR